MLRPGRPPEDAVFPGDDDPAALHVAAVAARDGAGETVLAVGSVLPEPAPWEPGRPAWRVRGMAARPEARGDGIGTAVLAALLAHVADRGGGLVWCTARTPAVTLYRRAGFVGRGEVVELPLVGPHLTMWRTVGGASVGTHADVGSTGGVCQPTDPVADQGQARPPSS